MVGKTNLTFISKGEGSAVQLIQKSYVTDAAKEIYKMKLINDRIFAFVAPDTVMSGTDINDLRFVEKDNAYLKATHIIYKDGKYYITCAETACLLYATSDFITFEKVELGEEITAMKSGGIFLDSRERIILALYNEQKCFLYIGERVEDINDARVVEVDGCYRVGWSNSRIYDNKIFVGSTDKNVISLNGSAAFINKIDYCNYAGGYFFLFSLYKTGEKIYTNLYRTRDGINSIKQCMFPGTNEEGYVFPINSRYCMLRAGCANIADDILSIGAPENVQIDIVDGMPSIASVLEYDGKTYLGTKNGIIYEYQLDYEGTMQRPDITIIKTLAAEQEIPPEKTESSTGVEALINTD